MPLTLIVSLPRLQARFPQYSAEQLEDCARWAFAYLNLLDGYRHTIDQHILSEADPAIPWTRWLDPDSIPETLTKENQSDILLWWDQSFDQTLMGYPTTG